MTVSPEQESLTVLPTSSNRTPRFSYKKRHRPGISCPATLLHGSISTLPAQGCFQRFTPSRHTRRLIPTNRFTGSALVSCAPCVQRPDGLRSVIFVTVHRNIHP